MASHPYEAAPAATATRPRTRHDFMKVNDLSGTMPDKTGELDMKSTEYLKAVGAETRQTIQNSPKATVTAIPANKVLD